MQNHAKMFSVTGGQVFSANALYVFNGATGARQFVARMKYGGSTVEVMVPSGGSAGSLTYVPVGCNQVSQVPAGITIYGLQ